MPSDRQDGTAKFVGLLDDFKLLPRAPAPAALNAYHHGVDDTEDIVIPMVVFLFLGLRNTDGTVFQLSKSD